jgi:galactose mutarotase-like enzyme
MTIETITLSDNTEVSFLPERGGIITSLTLQGVDILYLDQATLHDPARNVRGGIPILFPNAGAFERPEFPLLKQHGFARQSQKWTAEKTSSGFKETLVSDQESLSVYPYQFKLSLEGKFEDNNSFTLSQNVENTGDTTMPISMGLHPYFNVPNDEKPNIKFNFDGGAYIEQQIGQWSEGMFVSIDNPKTKDPTACMEVMLPTLGVLVIDACLEYRKIWIWSEPGKDFICIEPVMRDPGGLVDDPCEVQPKDIFRATVNFSLKK